MNDVFLGGTCNSSIWREELINKLDKDVKYFNPVVEDWTEDCMEEEIRQRETCNFVLYTITPEMKGVYSIAEVVDDSNKRPNKTMFLIHGTEEQFGKAQYKSLKAVEKMVWENDAWVFYSLQDVASFLNTKSKNAKRRTLVEFDEIEVEFVGEGENV